MTHCVEVVAIDIRDKNQGVRKRIPLPAPRDFLNIFILMVFQNCDNFISSYIFSKSCLMKNLREEIGII